MQRPGAVLSRAQLEDRLYGWQDSVESNAVEVYIHGLRRKLGADCHQDTARRGILPAQMTVSIRARLLITLLALATSVSLLAGVLTYRQVLAESSTLFDYQLRQMALSLQKSGHARAAYRSAARSGRCRLRRADLGSVRRSRLSIPPWFARNRAARAGLRGSASFRGRRGARMGCRRSRVPSRWLSPCVCGKRWRDPAPFA